MHQCLLRLLEVNPSTTTGAADASRLQREWASRLRSVSSENEAVLKTKLRLYGGSSRILESTETDSLGGGPEPFQKKKASHE